MTEVLPEIAYSRKAAALMNSPVVLALPPDQQWAIRDALAEHSTIDSLPPHIKRLFSDSIHPHVVQEVRLVESGFDPGKHPRGRRGRFIQHLRSMERNSMERFAHASVTRTHGGNWVVEPDEGERTFHAYAEDAVDEIERVSAMAEDAPASVLKPDTFKAIFDGFEHNGLRARVTTSTPGLVHGVIEAKVGNDWVKAGRFSRESELRDGQPSVYHDMLKLDQDFQGRGFGTAFFEHSLDEYRRLGVASVRVTAADQVGGYQWARRGFDFDTQRYGILGYQLVSAAGGGDMPNLNDERFARAFAVYDLHKLRYNGTPFAATKSYGGVPQEMWDEFLSKFPTTDQMLAFLKGDDHALDGTFSSPAEIAMFGREHRWVESHDPLAMGREMWLGKRFMLGAAWRGELKL